MPVGYAPQIYHSLPPKFWREAIPLNCDAQVLVQVLEVGWNLVDVGRWVVFEAGVAVEEGGEYLIINMKLLLIWIEIPILTRVEFGHHVYDVIETEDAYAGVEGLGLRGLDNLKKHLEHRNRIIVCQSNLIRHKKSNCG